MVRVGPELDARARIPAGQGHALECPRIVIDNKLNAATPRQ